MLLQVAERSGASLTSILCKSALEHVICSFVRRCDLCQAQPDNCICTIANCVYEAECKICDDEQYDGETGAKLGVRVEQHNSAIRNHHIQSALAEHVDESHHDSKIDFDFKIIRRTKDYVQRKCTEAVFVNRKKPSLNRKVEGNGILVELSQNRMCVLTRQTSSRSIDRLSNRRK